MVPSATSFSSRSPQRTASWSQVYTCMYMYMIMYTTHTHASVCTCTYRLNHLDNMFNLVHGLLIRSVPRKLNKKSICVQRGRSWVVKLSPRGGKQHPSRASEWYSSSCFRCQCVYVQHASASPPEFYPNQQPTNNRPLLTKPELR